jgi:hypothetical protein
MLDNLELKTEKKRKKKIAGIADCKKSSGRVSGFISSWHQLPFPRELKHDPFPLPIASED